MNPSGAQAVDTFTLPDSPAGRMLDAFLISFNSGDLLAYQSFFEKHLTASALNGQRLEQRVRSDASIFHWTRGLRIAILEQATDKRIFAHLQAALTDEWFRIQIEVAPDNAEAITVLTMRAETRPVILDRYAATGESEVLGRLQDLLTRLVEVDQFSGVVSIMREGQPVFQTAYGFASLPFRAPNQLDTKFNVGSMAKTFTAVAIAQLAERGKLHFDDLLSKYLPDYPADVAGRVTLNQLLTHTSGLGNYFNAKFEAARARLRSVSDFIPLFIDDPLAFEPGSRWSYSNAGYILLGAVIEKITGYDYYEVVRENIFRPAGMSETDSYEMDSPTQNLAIGYTNFGLDDYFDPTRRRNNLFLHVIKGGPAGGAFSTAADLHNFAKSLTENRLLLAENTENLMTGKVAIGSRNDKQYAYGLMVTMVDGKRIVGHSGTFPGIGAQLDLYLDHGYIVVILSNYDPHITQAISHKLREWIAGW